MSITGDQFRKQISFGELNAEQCFTLLYCSIQKLEYTISRISEHELLATTPAGTLIKINYNYNEAFVHFSNTDSAGDEVNKLISVYEQLKSSLSAQEIAEAYGKLKSEIADHASERINPDARQDNNFLESLKPSKGYLVTPTLFYVNVLIFVLMVVSGVNAFAPDSESLVKWGADYKLQTLNGEWWRAITCCFVHIGVIHLAMNMFALLDVGQLLERRIGSLKFLAAYLSAGILSSFVSLYWNENIVSAGASGALMGMYGFYLALLTTTIIEKNERSTQLRNMAIFLGYNLLFGLRGGVDNAAHIGGLLSGMLLGYCFLPILKSPANKKLNYITLATVAALTLSTSFYAYHSIPNPYGQFEKNMKQFSILEEEAVQFYRLPESTPVTRKNEVLEKGKKKWMQCYTLMNDLSGLKLDDGLKATISELKKYAQLRFKSYTLWQKVLNENSPVYHDSLSMYEQMVNEMLTKLNAASQ